MCEQETFVIHTSVRVRRLVIGETVERDDFYLSTSGSWNPTPIFGFALTEAHKETEYARKCQI